MKNKNECIQTYSRPASSPFKRDKKIFFKNKTINLASYNLTPYLCAPKKKFWV